MISLQLAGNCNFANRIEARPLLHIIAFVVNISKQIQINSKYIIDNRIKGW